jgi:Zn-dependent M28 family amino/carboxypeptidase
MRVMTKAACKRIGVLFVLLAATVYWLSGCMIRMPLKSYSGSWAPLDAREQEVERELRRHVEKLSGEIGEHNVFMPKKYALAADYIEGELHQSGYAVLRHSYKAQNELCHNLEVEKPGSSRKNEIVVIGAHYDSVAGCPGANDNSSGVAALLVLAKASSNAAPARTLRFVAFANEEPPFFQTKLMGSYVYAQECLHRKENIVAMLSLETIGYYTDEDKTQNYPFPLSAFYPSHGNFIGFVGNTASKKLVHDCIAEFRRSAQFPSEGAALPGGLEGVGWSDHWAFWQAGYPAIMITDTAPFRYVHYHTVNDTPEKLTYDRMARVVLGLKKVIEHLVL